MSNEARSEAQRVAVLTGAAGGIGEVTARLFAARNYDLVLLDCAADRLDSLAADLQNQCEILPLSGDLGDLGWCEAAIDTATQKFGRIDVLVNLAAWREITTMTTISLQSWERTLNICLTSPAFLARWCAAHMKPGSAIINISSLNARQSTGMAPAYVAAKGGLEALSHELAALYGPRGIRVVGLALGAIDTAMSHDVVSKSEDGPPAAEAPAEAASLRAFAEDMIPLRRFGTAEEAAQAIAWLASTDASYCTGTTIELDGGWGHHHFPHRWKQQLCPSEFA
jgi:3-oxoacyl-[acyl-carrier protein] reductase